jgi:selenocysteine lyase/cysteine desulfurase
MIHAGKENIALVPSASYGIAVAANNISLTAEQNIILADQQYPSNVYAWRELAKRTGAGIITVKKEGGQTWTEAILATIDTQTGLLALPNCHWTDGSLIDLEAVSKKAKEVNARLVIDASQSLGAYPLDINKIKPDFLVTVGYKWLLGAYGLSYLYADPQYGETGGPIEFSWLNKTGSEDFTRLVEYRDEYKPGAHRFDAGAFPGFINIPMATAALTQITAWGIDNIQETIAVLANDISRRAMAMGLETADPATRVGHLVGIKLSDSQMVTLAEKMAAAKIYTSFRGNSLRIAPHLYNSMQDIDRLFDCLGP